MWSSLSTLCRGLCRLWEDGWYLCYYYMFLLPQPIYPIELLKTVTRWMSLPAGIMAMAMSVVKLAKMFWMPIKWLVWWSLHPADSPIPHRMLSYLCCCNKMCTSIFIMADICHKVMGLWYGRAVRCLYNTPDNKVHGANMGPTWVLSAPDGPPCWPPCWPHEPCNITPKQDKGCLLWVQSMIFVLPQSLQCCVQHGVVLGYSIKALKCLYCHVSVYTMACHQFGSWTLLKLVLIYCILDTSFI